MPRRSSARNEFLASILPYTNAHRERLSIFLNFLTPKLPAPKEEDLSRGILEAIDMDSYRLEKQAVVKIQLPDKDEEIAPIPKSGGGHKPEPELDPPVLPLFNSRDNQRRDPTPDKVGSPGGNDSPVPGLEYLGVDVL